MKEDKKGKNDITEKVKNHCGKGVFYNTIKSCIRERSGQVSKVIFMANTAIKGWKFGGRFNHKKLRKILKKSLKSLKKYMQIKRNSIREKS